MPVKGSSLFGGGSVPINGVAPLNVGAVNKYVSPTSEVFIKTGVVEVNTGQYPYAYGVEGFVNVDSYSLGRSIFDLTELNGFLWGIDVTTLSQNKLVKYNLDGSEAGVEFLLPTSVSNSSASSPAFITSNGVDTLYLFARISSGSTWRLTHMDESGTVINTYSVPGSSNDYRGIASYSGSLYIVNTTGRQVVKMNATGKSEGVFSISATFPTTTGARVAPYGITEKDNYLWIISYYFDAPTFSEIKAMNPSDLTYAGFQKQLDSKVAPGLNTVSSDFILSSYGAISQWGDYDTVGITSAKTDTDTGLPIYVRVD